MKYKLSFLKQISIIAFAFLLLVSCSNGKYKKKRNLTVAFYNVENLFDTVDDPHKNDNEFLPGSKKKWTETRYTKKLEDLAKVLSSINKNELPEIVGLCEVENKKVLTDLVNTKYLSEGNYKIVHYESPDFRGIDCALIYRPDEFKVLKSFAVKVQFKDKPGYSTRDILYVKGKTKNRETLHIFVNHWPSRIGGVEKSEPRRVAVATILKSKIDSVLAESPKANIIVLGDMNDEPSNSSLAQVLGAQKPGTQNSRLINLMYPVHENKMGSYNYRGNWNMLDNIVVSESLLDNKGFRCTPEKGFVFHKEWMEYKNRKGEISPNRTYGGPNYYGGISDHFPVYFNLTR
jgi:predicted extracellular nuclease